MSKKKSASKKSRPKDKTAGKDKDDERRKKKKRKKKKKKLPHPATLDGLRSRSPEPHRNKAVGEWSAMVASPAPITELPVISAYEEPNALPKLGTQRRRRQRTRRRVLGSWLAIILVAVIAAFGLRQFFFEVFFVPSTSMVPTLSGGDRILVDKFDFHAGSLHVGDIVVFKTPPAAREQCLANEGDLVKRVIALPGQVVSSSGNAVYVNDKQLAERYLRRGTVLGRSIVKTVLGADEYFVMGDNRTVSCDSRYWGPVIGSQIVGRVVAILWHNGHPDLHFF